MANTTGSSALDTTSPSPTGTLAFTDVDLSDAHTVAVALTSAAWSVDPTSLPPQTLSDLQTALATALHDSTGSGSGGIDWTFSIPDKDLDFLSAGETLTATYNVTVMDGTTSSTQMVTITMNGASDPIVVNPVTASIADTPPPMRAPSLRLEILSPMQETMRPMPAIHSASRQSTAARPTLIRRSRGHSVRCSSTPPDSTPIPPTRTSMFCSWATPQPINSPSR
jgi:VCBS repeat-containing protein